MLINYITERDGESILSFSLLKLLQTTQRNPEPHTIGVQKEKSLRPRISAKGTKYRHQLYNPSHTNPSTPNPISCVTPSPHLVTGNVRREKEIQAGPDSFPQLTEKFNECFYRICRNNLLLLWQQLGGIHQGSRSLMQGTTHMHKT